MIDSVTVMEFQIEYPNLNLKLKKKEENKFEYALIYLAIKECSKGFKIKRINKTTKEGTKIAYKTIADKEELEEYTKELENKAREFNKKHGEGFISRDAQNKY